MYVLTSRYPKTILPRCFKFLRTFLTFVWQTMALLSCFVLSLLCCYAAMLLCCSVIACCYAALCRPVSLPSREIPLKKKKIPQIHLDEACLYGNTLMCFTSVRKHTGVLSPLCACSMVYDKTNSLLREWNCRCQPKACAIRNDEEMMEKLWHKTAEKMLLKLL